MLLLNGHCVLLVEDEPIIALDLQDCLQTEGARVLCAGSLARGVELASTSSISAAVIDYELKGEDGDPLCITLNRRGIPFLFYTGHDATDLHNRWSDTPILSKPARYETFVRSVLALIQSPSPADQPGDLFGSPEQR